MDSNKQTDKFSTKIKRLKLPVTKIKIIAVYLNPYRRVSLSCLTFHFVLNIMPIMFTRIDHVRVSSQRERKYF